HHPDLHSFPTRRSSDLLAYSRLSVIDGAARISTLRNYPVRREYYPRDIRHDRKFSSRISSSPSSASASSSQTPAALRSNGHSPRDRKSTRLNSSHVKIS